MLLSRRQRFLGGRRSPLSRRTVHERHRLLPGLGCRGGHGGPAVRTHHPARPDPLPVSQGRPPPRQNRGGPSATDAADRPGDASRKWRHPPQPLALLGGLRRSFTAVFRRRCSGGGAQEAVLGLFRLSTSDPPETSERRPRPTRTRLTSRPGLVRPGSRRRFRPCRGSAPDTIVCDEPFPSWPTVTRASAAPVNEHRHEAR